MIERTLLWTPRAKGRPRAHVIGGKAIMFTPKETTAAERALAGQWTAAPLEGPLRVELYLSDTDVTVNVSQDETCVATKLRRGDIDNYAKLIMDALNGRAWLDDNQIMRLFVRKM